MSLDTFQEGIEIGAGEFPLEGDGDLLVILLETKEAVFKFGQRCKIVWSEDFALDDREVDLDLVEPTGVNRAMDGNHVGEGYFEAAHAAAAAMGGSVVTQKTRRAVLYGDSFIT